MGHYSYERNEAYKKRENLKELVKDKPWLKGMFEKDLHKAELEHLRAEIKDRNADDLARERERRGW